MLRMLHFNKRIVQDRMLQKEEIFQQKAQALSFDIRSVCLRTGIAAHSTDHIPEFVSDIETMHRDRASHTTALLKIMQEEVMPKVKRFLISTKVRGQSSR